MKAWGDDGGPAPAGADDGEMMEVAAKRSMPRMTGWETMEVGRDRETMEDGRAEHMGRQWRPTRTPADDRGMG